MAPNKEPKRRKIKQGETKRKRKSCQLKKSAHPKDSEQVTTTTECWEIGPSAWNPDEPDRTRRRKEPDRMEGILVNMF